MFRSGFFSHVIYTDPYYIGHIGEGYYGGQSTKGDAQGGTDR